MKVPAPEPASAPDDALPLARRLARAREAGALSLFFRRTRAVARLPMVGWYDPGQLLDTGLKTLFSTIGRRATARVRRKKSDSAPASRARASRRASGLSLIHI